ncbi:MAG: hypothetical protein ACKVZJ_08475 [Phycisphaerales bacterium]
MTPHRLLAIVMMGTALAPAAHAQLTYSNLFALGEANSEVKAMIVWDDDGPGPHPLSMVIGGSFSNAGGVPAARVAQWNGTNWNALGTGMSGGNVFALAAFDDDAAGPNPERLYAAGTFTSASGVTANRIARWNGTAWEPLPGGGLNGQVNTLCVYNGLLYAGGFFTQAGTGGTPVSAGALASYNGTAWTGRSLSSTVVNALAVHDDGQGGGNQLYIGGNFSGAPGIANSGRIVRFNGTAFSAVGGGISGSVNGSAGPRVNALTIHNGQLYAAGAFANAGAATGVNSVARWDGVNWNGVGGGIVVSDNVGATCMVSYADSGQPARLHVGGSFTAVGPAGAVAANRIAAFDGSAWTALGTGLNIFGPTVMAVAPPPGLPGSSLHVGGTFNSAGGYPASNLGRWRNARWSTLGLGFKSTASDASIRVIKFPQNPALQALPPAAGRDGPPDGDPNGTRGDGPPISGSDLRSVVYVGGAAMTPGFAENSTLPKATITAFNEGTLRNEPIYAFNPGDNNGTVLDLAITESDQVICTGSFTQCNGQLAGGLGYWEPVTFNWEPWGLPGIAGLTNSGTALLGLPSDETLPNRIRIFTNAFEIGGLNAPWGATWVPGKGFVDGSFIVPIDDTFPRPTDGPVTELELAQQDLAIINYFFGALASPPAAAGPAEKVAVVAGNYSELSVPGAARTNVGNAYVNFVNIETGTVFGPGQPPTGPCTALAWCPKSFFDKTGFIIVAGGPSAIAGYNGTSWVVIGNAKNGGGDGLVADIAFMNADNDIEWEMFVGGTITSVQQGGVVVATCRNLLRADATGPGAVTWSKIIDPATGVDGTDNTVWALELGIVIPPSPLPQTYTQAMHVGGQFRSAGGYSAGRFTTIYGPTIAPACFADFNDDGPVNTADLTTFLGRFGSPANSSPRAFRADFNRDGTVNTPDLVFFLGRFGQTCP